MRKPAGTLGISLFGPGKLWFKKVCDQNMCIDFLAELDHSEEKVFGSKSFWVKKVFGSKNNWGPLSSTFHVGRPETLTDWKFESVTDGRTYGRTDI